MDYQLFSKLYQEALDYDDPELYIAERGWEDWMESFPPVLLGTILKNIFDLAHNNFKENREKIGLNQKSFSARYNIPVTTVGKWERGERELSPWLKMLIDYSIYGDLK